MKRTDLEKHQGKKIVGAMQREPTSERYGASAGAHADKRVQRERDKAAGLVPFAIKLPQDLVASLHALAIERGVPMNQLAEALLRAGIGHEPPAPK
jgi:hypothetical protein